MSPIPVGVIKSSARMTPTKPAAQPSLSPAKIMGLAAGRMILPMSCAREARKARPISTSELGVCRTALSELSTITGMAMMHTVRTLAVRPIP